MLRAKLSCARLTQFVTLGTHVVPSPMFQSHLICHNIFTFNVC